MAAQETNLYSWFLLQAPTAIAVLRGPNHVFEFANDRYLQAIGGRSPIGKPIKEALPELSGQPFFALLDQAYTTGERFCAHEMPALLERSGDGTLDECFFNFVYQPTHDAEGRVDGIVVHAVEVTEQILAQRRAEALARDLQALKLLVEASDALCSSLDLKTALEMLPRVAVPRLADLCCIYLQPEQGGPIELAAMTHIDPAKGELIRELAWRSSPPENPSHPCRRVLETGEAQLLPSLSEAWFASIAEDDALLALMRAIDVGSLMFVPLVTQGRVFGLISFGLHAPRQRYSAEDLVLAQELGRRAAIAIDHAQLFKAAQRERAQAEEANRSKDAFLAMISHELRTPLTAMLGWTAMLRAGILSEERQRRALETIERNARAQQQLIEDMLDITRVISGKLRLDVRPVELQRIIEAALDVVRPAAAAKAIQLLSSIDPGAGAILGDVDRLQQVFCNLLTNAIKFTPACGRVKVTLRRRRAHVEVVVTDSGRGIRPEFLPYVFERFRQADSSVTRAHGGLGLGLSIVRNLVALHGGTIEAASEGEGKGATFTVRLPSSTAQSSRVEHAACCSAPGDPSLFVGSSELSDVRVLVVEDEADARELLVTVLEQCRAEVTAAAATTAALEVLPRTLPHVIVSDIGMPEEDGYTLIRRVRALPDEALARTPAVALTAYARAEDRTRAMLEGFNVHLAKPVQPSELVAVVQDLAGRRAAR